MIWVNAIIYKFNSVDFDFENLSVETLWDHLNSVRSENESPYTATMYFFLVIFGQSSKLSAP